MTNEVVKTGWRARTTPSGIRVIELDYIADPVKRDPAWVTEMRKLYPNDRAFRREFMRDWAAAAGEPYYPEFVANGGKDVYVRPAPGLIPGVPIIRGWDFGFRRPAVVWMQRNPKNGRVWWLREFMPENIGTPEYADIVLYLSGQLALEQLPEVAMEWVARINADPAYPNAPWFKTSTAAPLHFVDFSGHEALEIASVVSADKQERINAEILISKGIQLQAHYITVKAREQIIRKMLMPQKDGFPGMFIDPACDLLIKGLLGGFSYAKETKMDPHPEKPHKDGYYEHIHDAAGYAAVGAVPLIDWPPAKAQLVIRDRRPALEVGDGWEDLGFSETRSKVGR